MIAMAACIPLGIVLGCWVGSQFGSTPAPQPVDGIALTASELEFVRGLRRGMEQINAPRKDILPMVEGDLLAKLAKGEGHEVISQALRRVR
jgi:hypothetical protein